MVTTTPPALRFTPPAMSVSLERITDFLATVPLFRSLDRAAVRTFAELTREQRVGRAARVITAGERTDALYIVRTGEVKLVLDGTANHDVILDVLGVGEHFGELALIDGEPRQAHVIATQPSSLLVFRRGDFRRQAEQYPPVVWGLLLHVARRLRHANRTIGSLVRVDVPGRVARTLLAHTLPDASGSLVRPLTHQTMAQMIGASRETVSRAMADFQAKGWIGVSRRAVTILDRAALEARARPRP